MRCLAGFFLSSTPEPGGPGAAARLSSGRRGPGPLRPPAAALPQIRASQRHTALPRPPTELLFLHIALRHGALHDDLVAIALPAAAAAPFLHGAAAPLRSPRRRWRPPLPPACRAAPPGGGGVGRLVEAQSPAAPGCPWGGSAGGTAGEGRSLAASAAPPGRVRLGWWQWKLRAALPLAPLRRVFPSALSSPQLRQGSVPPRWPWAPGPGPVTHIPQQSHKALNVPTCVTATIAPLSSFVYFHCCLIAKILASFVSVKVSWAC